MTAASKLIRNQLFRQIFLGTLLLSLQATPTRASVNAVEVTQKSAENQIRHLVEPLLDKYCHDQCKLLSVNVTVDVAIPDEIAPGFNEIQLKNDKDLAPTSARIKLLMDDKVGPVSRGKLLELLQQYLDTLDYTVKVDTQVTHFPQPVGSEGKITDLRERIGKQFTSTISELVSQFCPDHCLFVDFNLKTDVVNSEETQYGSPGEFVQEGGVALRIRDISGTLLMDENLSADERANILEMAKLKTNSFKNVSLTAKALKFPRPPMLARGVTPGFGGLAQAGSMPLDKNGATNSENSTQNSTERSLASETNTTNNQRTDSSHSTSTNSNETKHNTSSKESSQNTSNSNNNSTNSNSSNLREENTKQERYERIEKIERVENGDAIQTELQKFKVYGLIFGCSILSLLVFVAVAGFRSSSRKEGPSTIHRIVEKIAGDPMSDMGPARAAVSGEGGGGEASPRGHISTRYENERLVEELAAVFAQNPKVAKHVFSRILTEEGLEVAAQYIHIFGEGIVMDMLYDPSLQSDLSELTEYYAKNPIELKDDEKLDLLRKLHSRTVAGKLAVLGNRSSTLFDFLTEMDSTQILELIRTESLTVKAIVLTQCDTQKRTAIYAHLDETVRMKLLTELSRIDYLPRDYVFNVANALKRKRRDNPKLNTEALPGSEVLVTLLERTGMDMQRNVIKNLESSSPDSARTVKSKLVSIDTLRFLRDSQLLEVILSLRHDELLQFLKGAMDDVRNIVFAKSPKELVAELEEELATIAPVSREAYHSIERKVLNRMKIMANEGLINLVETNERMFSEGTSELGYPTNATGSMPENGANIKKVAGW